MAKKKPKRTAVALKTDPDNARIHDERNRQAIASSLQQFGAGRSILADADGIIRAGNGTFEEAQRLGLKHRIVETDGSELVVVKRTDLKGDRAKAMGLADNRTSDLSHFDQAKLDALCGELRGAFDLDSFGLSTADLDELCRELRNEAKAGLTDPDVVPEPPKVPVTKPGDLWLLGEHRLLCGDSTKAEDVERVMGGERAGLCFTSPPYAQQRAYTQEASEHLQDWYALMCGVFANLPMADDGQVLVNLGLVHKDGEWVPYWDEWIGWMREQGWRRFGWYVWDQGPGLPGDWAGRLAPAFEWVFHLNRIAIKPKKTQECKHAGLVYEGKGGLRGKDGDVNEWSHRNQPVQSTKIPDSVCRVSREKSSYLYGHPAMFSAGMARYFIEAWPGLVYEPFSGSGTTIIAAEQLNRRCRAIEIAPQYVDVAVQRWQNFTGKTATLSKEKTPRASRGGIGRAQVSV